MRIGVIGSGYRAKYYFRVVKRYEKEFSIEAVLVHRKESIDVVNSEWGFFATTDEEEFENKKLDAIVVSVSKPMMYDIARKWKLKGYKVICETPVGITMEQLKQCYEEKDCGGELIVAEQYMYYPTYRKAIDIVNDKTIGEPVCVNLSIAHEYHGMSVLRKLLKETPEALFKMNIKKYEFDVTKTHDRYVQYKDGEIIKRQRVIANVEFEDGKVGIYDFDSEQYHSLIRHNFMKVTGTRGEIINERLWYLDDKNELVEETITKDFQKVQEELSEDEEAVHQILMFAQNAGREEINENLVNALQDAYMTILMNQKENEICSKKQPWC